MKILFWLFMANMFSYCCLSAMKFRPVVFKREWNNPASNTMNYLLAGLGSQPKPAFQAFYRDFFARENLTYCQFDSRGFDALESASRIVDDVRRNKFQNVRIYAISVGERVAEMVEMMMFYDMDAKIEIIAINPCPGKEHLRLKARVWLVPAMILVNLVSFLLGWLSVLPVIWVGKDQKISVRVLADQLFAMCQSWEHDVERVSGVVLSSKDRLLDNRKSVRAYGRVAKLGWTKTKHAQTIIKSEEYLTALKVLKEKVS